MFVVLVEELLALTCGVVRGSMRVHSGWVTNEVGKAGHGVHQHFSALQTFSQCPDRVP